VGVQGGVRVRELGAAVGAARFLAMQGAGGDSKYVLTQGIARISTAAGYEADWAALFAALTLSILPMIVVYAFFQRHIQRGLTAGAVK